MDDRMLVALMAAILEAGDRACSVLNQSVDYPRNYATRAHMLLHEVVMMQNAARAAESQKEEYPLPY